MSLRLAIVGIRGIPNNYGGFETLTEYLAEYLSKDFIITVYCSSADMPTKPAEYKGVKLKYVPVSSHGAWGIVYDSISLLDAIFKNDKVLFLGFGGGFVIPLIKKYKSKIILNIGGLDWSRNKWSSFAQSVIKKAEGHLVMNSGQIVADNVKIKEYLLNTYGKESTLIAYGGDQAKKTPITLQALKSYPFLNRKYAFTVTRIQSDNNIDMLLEAFAGQDDVPLVIVGNWNDSPYGIQTKAKYEGTDGLILLDAIYDRSILDILRSNCTIYIHGHSAGGTNPSLVEAMHLELPVYAYASGYNESTTENKAKYFRNKEELQHLVSNFPSFNLQQMGKDLKETAERLYTWSKVTDQYKAVILNA